MSVKLKQASQYSIQELTDAYNQTRVDYLVPMPMNANRLQEYIDVYDIDLNRSFVADDNDQILGLAMLGMRPPFSWITRLGVIPNGRRGGIGEQLMCGLLEASGEAGINHNILEVIAGNHPAHALFVKLGFEEIRQLLILRRAPKDTLQRPRTNAEWYPKEVALTWLDEREGLQPWTNQISSINNAEDILGLKVTLPGQGKGWLTVQKNKFNLSRIMYHTIGDDRPAILQELLLNLHFKYPFMDTYTENILEDDPHLPAFKNLGYFEVFRRIEMYRFN